MYRHALSFLTLLLCLSLLLSAVFSPVPAKADLNPDLPVYEILRNGTAVGTGVLFLSDTILLTTAQLEEEDTGIRVRVGAGLVTPEIYADSDGLLTVLMLPSSLPGTPLQPETSGSLNLQYAGFDTRGTLNKGACTQTVVTQSPSGLTFSACPGLVPGTALIGPEGGLAGLMAASLGEGINRYYALSIDEIYDRLMADNSPKAPEGFLKAEGTVEKNRVTLTWNQPETGETTFCVYMEDTLNGYYSYILTEKLSANLGCVPGRTYNFYVRALPSAEADPNDSQFPEDLAVQLTIPLKEEVGQYSFKDTEAYLAYGKPDETQEDVMTALPKLDDPAVAFSHGDTHIFLQVTSTYEVTEEIHCDLTCVLYAPDGSCYDTVSGYIYAPAYMPEDKWHIEITTLFDNCLLYCGAMDGTYYVRYFLDEALASEVSFTIGEPAKPDPALDI